MQVEAADGAERSKRRLWEWLSLNKAINLHPTRRPLDNGEVIDRIVPKDITGTLLTSYRESIANTMDSFIAFLSLTA